MIFKETDDRASGESHECVQVTPGPREFQLLDDHPAVSIQLIIPNLRFEVQIQSAFVDSSLSLLDEIGLETHKIRGVQHNVGRRISTGRRHPAGNFHASVAPVSLHDSGQVELGSALQGRSHDVTHDGLDLFQPDLQRRLTDRSVENFHNPVLQGHLRDHHRARRRFLVAPFIFVLAGASL